jgi:GNAT superfamily N-acetyltransferase
MPELPPGWATDLAVLEYSGSEIDDRGDHLVIRSPQNPSFHWGNCLLVTEQVAVDDAERWVETFRAAFPDASWVAIGLARMPGDEVAWTQLGLELELDDVLSTRSLPRQTPAPEGYVVRQLDGDDWERSVERGVRGHDGTAEDQAQSHQQFVRARMVAQRALSERGVAAFFGAFAGGELVAELGIVRCLATARYQNVGTDERHRRRGLAAHLLGLAALWSAERGCDTWVIVTEADNPAGRVYRAAGFELDSATVQAYRPPEQAG